MADLTVLANFWAQYGEIIEAVIVTLVFFGVARLVNWVLKHEFVSKITAKTKTNLDDMLLKALRTPITFAFVLLGLFIGITSISYLTPYEAIITEAFSFVQIFFTAFVVARVINTIMEWYAKDVAVKTESKLDDHFLPAIKKAVYIITFAVAVVFAMRGFGVEVTTLVAALGVGGLAIGLALQDTLSNFFAGAYTTLEKPIRVSDFIELETGEKGYVQEIGWRTTKLKMLNGNMLILPNNKIAQFRIVNYNMPEPGMSAGLSCGVSYDSDLDEVEKVVLDVAKKVMKEHAGVTDFQKFPPSVRFSEFGDSNINFSLWFKVNSAVDQYRVKHEMIKALKRRFDKEGIEISYPARKIYTGKTRVHSRKK